jgi:hypothetical protein
MQLEDYVVPVWTTQHGGLVQRNDLGKFVFIEVPKAFPKNQPGDLVPEGCEFIPANQLAEKEEEEEIRRAEEAEEEEEKNSEPNPFSSATFVGREGGPID